MSSEDKLKDKDRSSVKIEIRIDELWINRSLAERSLTIPINEQIQLTNLSIAIQPSVLGIHAELKDKEGSSVAVAARPVWDAQLQHLRIEDLHVDTSSKNIFLKGAGWFAEKFLTGKVDSKIEEQVNRLLKEQLTRFTSGPVNLPIPKMGHVRTMLSSVTIHELTLVQGAVIAKLTIDGHYMIDLV